MIASNAQMQLDHIRAPNNQNAKWRQGGRFYCGLLPSLETKRAAQTVVVRAYRSKLDARVGLPNSFCAGSLNMQGNYTSREAAEHSVTKAGGQKEGSIGPLPSMLPPYNVNVHLPYLVVTQRLPTQPQPFCNASPAASTSCSGYVATRRSLRCTQISPRNLFVGESSSVAPRANGGPAYVSVAIALATRGSVVRFVATRLFCTTKPRSPSRGGRG